MFLTNKLRFKCAGFDVKESFSNWNNKTGYLSKLIAAFWNYCWCFDKQWKPENTPTADEDKTRFELNYPIYILICHTPGSGCAIISYHRSCSWQHVCLALSEAGPIRQAWWSQRKGWEGRWGWGDVLCMGRKHALRSQLRPPIGGRQTDPAGPIPQWLPRHHVLTVLWDGGQSVLLPDPGHRSSTVG